MLKVPKVGLSIRYAPIYSQLKQCLFKSFTSLLTTNPPLIRVIGMYCKYLESHSFTEASFGAGISQTCQSRNVMRLYIRGRSGNTSALGCQLFDSLAVVSDKYMDSGHVYEQAAKGTGRVISAESAAGTRTLGAGERRMGEMGAGTEGMEGRGGGRGEIRATMNGTWRGYV